MAEVQVNSFERQDQELLAALEAVVVPSLLKRKSTGEQLRIWLPDCGAGELAYALAALLLARADHYDVTPAIKIFATEANPDALTTARSGRNGAALARLAPARLLQRYFRYEPPHYQALPHVREQIVFAAHELLIDPPFAHLDLIVCRQLFATLPLDAQDQVLATFHWSLRPQGALMLAAGAASQLLPKLFVNDAGARLLYRSSGAPATLPIARPGLERRRPADGTPLEEANRHLVSMNQALRNKIGDLGRANDDLNNLIGAADLAMIFLDQRLRITRFTPQAAALFNLIPADQDRPLGNIRPALEYAELLGDAAATLAHLQMIEREVQSSDSRWYLVRLRPYRTKEDRIAGVVLVCIDITSRRQAELALRRARDELELRVAERTEALTVANHQLQAEIAERARLEQERSELMRQLVRAQEDERHNVARELHDELGQTLTALGLGLAVLPKQLRDPEGFSQALAQLQQLVRQLDQDMSRLAVELRPTALDDLGLLSALQHHIERWVERGGVHAELEVLGPWEVRLPREIESAVYRVVQEALTNVLKHAAAHQVSIILDRRADQLRLIIEDDGRGFAVDGLQPATDGRSHLGLVGMRERMALLRGTIEFQSELGAGTTLFIQIPLPALPAAEPATA